MELSISLLKDASSAVDALVGAFGKLGDMLVNATGTGLEIAGYRRTSAAIERLKKLSTQITILTETQCARFMPSLREYADSPTPEHWNTIRQGIDNTIEICSHLLDQVKSSSDDIATKDFFGELIRLILERDRTLVCLRDGPSPITLEALDALREHIEKYGNLLDQLRSTNRVLMAYIDCLKSSNKFPAKA
jgi:hypothetical protein